MLQDINFAKSLQIQLTIFIYLFIYLFNTTTPLYSSTVEYSVEDYNESQNKNFCTNWVFTYINTKIQIILSELHQCLIRKKKNFIVFETSI